MKKSILLSTILILLFLHNAKSQQFKWIKGGGSTQSISISTTPGAWNVEGTYFMCTDANGNIYALSEVGNNNINADTFYRSNAYGASANVLFSSYTCSGQMRWAKLISGDETIPQGVIADNSGHVYLAMDLFHNPTLHIGYDTAFSTYTFERDALIQYDTSGRFHWIRFIGDNTASTEYGTGGTYTTLVLDGNNYPHLISYMFSGVHLTSTITSQYGFYDLKYSTTGTLLSANRLQIDSSWVVEGTTIDAAGKLYVCGEKNINYGTDQFFTAAFDTGRHLIWMYELDTAGGTAISVLTSITSDNTGHLYFSGLAQSPLLIGATTFTFRGISSSNAYAPYYDISVIMKTDTSANPVWIKHYDGNSNNGFTSITANGNKIAAAGYFFDEVTNSTDTISAGVGTDPFFAIVDTNGISLAFKEVHGDGYYDVANVITGDKKGNLYIGGRVEDSIGAGTVRAYHSVGGNSDFFIMKYGYDCNCAVPTANFTHFGTKNSTFTYTGSSTFLDSVAWTFGDGGHATGNTVTHVYTSTGNYNVCATAYTSCGSNKYCSMVTISTSVANLALFPGIKVYPNPVSSILNIAYVPMGTELKIFNIVGQAVYQGVVENEPQQINMSFLPSGTYVLQLTDKEGGRAGMTIIKQ